MSRNRSPQPTEPGSRREALRSRQLAAQKATRRTALAIRAAWVVGLAVIAVMIGVTAWTVARPGSAGVAAASLVAPVGATDAGSVVIGDRTAPVTISVYADFLCPYCGQFEQANGADLDQALASGQAKIEFHPMAFLDRQSAGTKYSTRAANAFVAVADADPAQAWAFSKLLYANQPKEGAAGLTDAKLVELATQAGAGADVTATFARQTWVPWIQKLTQQAWDSGLTGTPTVKINGQLFTGDVYTAGPLAAAIAQAGRE